jgi:predicted kinase
VGKSTLARWFVERHPRSLCLDIDGIRRQIGHWQEASTESGRLARSLALAMLGQHLRGGNDVIVPQYLGRPDFIEALTLAANEADAQFFEIVLMDTRENALARFWSRASDAELATHHSEASQMISGETELADMYDRLKALLTDRPQAQIIQSTEGAIESDYESLLSALDEHP